MTSIYDVRCARCGESGSIQRMDIKGGICIYCREEEALAKARGANKRYTYTTTYIVKASNEATAGEVREKVESQLRPDTLVAEYWTKLTDIEDDPKEARR